MPTSKRRRLEAAGWRVGKAADLLDLSPGEALYVEIKLALANALRARRTKFGLTQAHLAQRMRSSQSRVAKLENGADGVSLDLLFRALYALGVSDVAIAREIARKRPAA